MLPEMMILTKIAQLEKQQKKLDFEKAKNEAKYSDAKDSGYNEFMKLYLHEFNKIIDKENQNINIEKKPDIPVKEKESLATKIKRSL